MFYMTTREFLDRKETSSDKFLKKRATTSKASLSQSYPLQKKKKLVYNFESFSFNYIYKC